MIEFNFFCCHISGDTMIIRMIRETHAIDEGIFEIKKILTQVDLFQDKGRFSIFGKTNSLNAVLYHKGYEGSTGHYVVESIRPTKIRNEVMEQGHYWFYFDDGKVIRQDVEFPDFITDDEIAWRRSSAYMMMYRLC